MQRFTETFRTIRRAIKRTLSLLWSTLKKVVIFIVKAIAWCVGLVAGLVTILSFFGIDHVMLIDVIKAAILTIATFRLGLYPFIFAVLRDCYFFIYLPIS